MVAGAAALDAACGPRGGPSGGDGALEPLRFVSWSAPRAEQANLFAAEDLGYFADQGIAFQYQPGQGSGDAMKQILAGNGDVGFVGPEAIYFTADQGGDAVGIYNTYPQSIFVLLSWPDVGIQRPADLRGRTIAVLSQASGSRYNVLSLLARGGLKEADVTLVATGNSPAPFLERKVDAWSTITTTAAEVQRQTGQRFDALYARDYLNLPTDVFATTREIYTRQADLLLRFLRAVRKGTEYMIANSGEAAKIAVQHALDQKDPLAAEASIRTFGDASQGGGAAGRRLGYFDLAVLREGAAVYNSAGLTRARVDVDRYFTNDLVARL